MASALVEDSVKVYVSERADQKTSRCPCKSSESPQTQYPLANSAFSLLGTRALGRVIALAST